MVFGSKGPKENGEDEVKLKVGELTNREEAGRGIVRIDSNMMKKLGIKEGDIIGIEGKRMTGAIAVRSYPADIGLNIIRMDGITRRNASSGVGEIVKIGKSDVKEAKKVVLAPAEKGMIVRVEPELFKQNIYMRAVAKGDIIIPSPVVKRRGNLFEDFPFFNMEDFFPEVFMPMPTETRFIVTNTDPVGIVKIGEMTELEMLPQLPDSLKLEDKSVPTVTYEDVGGIKPIVEKVREIIELPLRHPELFEKLGIDAPKGVLLYGPPGTGKTLLAKAVANESGANFISISGPEIMNKFYGESEANIRRIFDEAEKNAPSIVFIDEIDAIAPKREDVTGEVEKRVVSQLLTQMDGLKSRGKVVVIAATNRPNSLDPALRRAGRFDREIEFPVPDREGRLEIFKIHARNMPLIKDVNLEELADKTYGYVGADIMSLCKEAAMSTLRRVLPDIKWREEGIPKEMLEKLVVSKDDFENALRIVEPSAMREIMVEIPNVKWTDIGGLDELKQQLKEMIEWPLKNTDAFKKMGIQPPKGILLYGPPGCGKTMIAKAVANESKVNFISIKGPEVLSMWVGESEKRIRELFRKAKQVAPSIIFLDELDSLAPKRGAYSGSHVTETVVSQLLTEISGIEDLKGVVIIAATNRPELIDNALLRPGRIDRFVMIPPPDEKSRMEILKVHTKNMPLAKDVNLHELVKETEGFSGADIEALVREAGMTAMREDMKSGGVEGKHFDGVLKRFIPSISNEMLDYYKSFSERQKRLKEKQLKADEDLPSYIG